MRKSQIIIIIVGLCAAIFIFSLPKVIIKNEKQLASTENKQHGASKPDMEKIHHVSLSNKDSLKLAELTYNFLTVSDNKKKLIFADSLAKYYRDLHHYDSSAKYQEEIAKIEPSVTNWDKSGDAFYKAFDFASDSEKPEFHKRARYYFEKVLDKNPNNLEAKSKLAMTYVGGEETMKAVKLLREVIEADPKNQLAIYNLGILSIQSGQYEKAIKRFKELIAVNPSNANGHFYLGVCYMNTNDKSRARESFETAKGLEKDPAFQSAIESYLNEINNK